MTEEEYLRSKNLELISPEEQKKIKLSLLGAKVITCFIMLIPLIGISVPATLLSGDNNLIIAGIIITSLSLSIASYKFVLKKISNNLYQDLQHKMKYKVTGTITEKKWISRPTSTSTSSSASSSRRYYIKIDEVLKLSLIKEEYYRVEEGDNVTVEFSQHAKLLFSLKK